MKLIENFVEKFHNYSLPTPENCFVLEEGDELYINKWIKNGKINGKMKDIFEWIEKKYLSNKKQLEKTDKKKFDELNFEANPRWQLDSKAKFLKGAGVKI